MHYDLKQDGNTGNWWVICQEDSGFREIVKTLSADLTYSEAKVYMHKFIELERMNG